jgi:HSP20 family protein
MVSLIRRGGSPLAVRRGNEGVAAPMVRVEPWNDFSTMDRLFDTFWRTPFSLMSGATQSAATDATVELYETKDELIAFVTAPGIAPDTLDISAQADTITVKGERKPLLEASEGLVSHTPWGGTATTSATFSASYSLPIEIDPDKVQASYKDGILKVRMPKAEAAKPRQVKVSINQ